MDLEKLKKDHIGQKEVLPPQGYLEGLESRVLKKKNERERTSKVLGLRREVWLSAAAFALILLGLSQFVKPDTLSADEILAQLPEDQQVQYYLATAEEEWWVDDEWMDDVTVEEYFEILDQQLVDDEVFENLY